MKTNRLRLRIAALALLFCVALFPLLSLSSCQTVRRYVKTIDGPFDTVTQLVIYTTSSSAAGAFFSYFSDELAAWDKLADIYYEYDGIPNLRTLNLSAGSGPVALDPRLLDLLEYGLAAKEKTGGVVDLLLGPVLAVWHAYRSAGIADPENAALPTDAELARAYETARSGELLIDRTAGTAELTSPGMSVDVGSFAKGYATEVISKSMEDRGYSDFAANVGGNLRISGSASCADWSLSVRDPAGNGTVGEMLRHGVASLATSGSYQRFYTVDGVDYHHILDPETLWPARCGWTSVSILTPDAGVADVLSTALFCLDRETGVLLISTFESPIDVLWIAEDGSVFTTDGLKGEVKR